MPTAQQIRTEIDNDPKALGYAALRAQSNGPEALAAKLNQAGASSETLFRSYVPLADVLACVVASEYGQLSTANKTLWQDLVVRSAQLKSGDANMRATIARHLRRRHHLSHQPGQRGLPRRQPGGGALGRGNRGPGPAGLPGAGAVGMSATIQLGPYRAWASVLSTGLNALAATTGKAISAAIDNSVTGDLFDDLELSVTFASAPTAGTVVELYLLPSIDGGTTYPDGSSSVTPQSSLYVGGFAVRAVTTAQVMVLRGVALPPGSFKYLVQNTTNQAFPATGSTLERNSYQLLSV
jgi:hypothetical protein